MKKKIKKIIENALQTAAFNGFDEDDDYSTEMFDSLVDDTIKEIEKVMGKID